MDNGKSGVAQVNLPQGFKAVPIHPANAETPLRLCVLLRQTPDPVGGSFVLLRDVVDAKVYLGCITDFGGRPREWVEIWVQDSSGLEATFAAHREIFSNHFLDDRWRQHHRALVELNPSGVIETGWESTHPAPMFIDPAKGAVRVPIDPVTHQPWQVCLDDALLQASELPPYTTSLSRNLYVRESGKPARFVSADSAAGGGSLPAPLAEALGPGGRLVPFNPQAGLMMVRSFHPIGGEDFIDLLGGKPWPGCVIAKRNFDLCDDYTPLQEGNPLNSSQALFFLGTHGKAGRLMEVFHLKVRLVLEMVKLVRSYVRARQLPLLNLSPDSFRFKLGDGGTGLPRFWTAQGALVKPGQSVALSVPMARQRYFMRVGEPGAQIFQPENLSVPSGGTGTVRVRKVLSKDENGFSIEATLDMGDSARPAQLHLSPNDLLWIRLPLASGRIDLYGHVYAGENLAYGEARFHTLPLKLPEAAAKALQSSGPVSFRGVAYEVVPLFSSPCDLYALGVLAVRTLLADEQLPLQVALDEVFSLARQLKVDHKPDVALNARLKSIFERDPRWLPSLGPHHLTRESWSPQEALDLISCELWFDTLGTIAAMFPGRGPDSACRDFGDVAEQALETAFNRSLEQWENLLLRSRSLLFVDWKWTREIAQVVQDLIDQSAVK